MYEHTDLDEMRKTCTPPYTELFPLIIIIIAEKTSFQNGCVHLGRLRTDDKRPDDREGDNDDQLSRRPDSLARRALPLNSRLCRRAYLQAH